MQVETYEVEELADSEATTMAADSEAVELIVKLGLSGQLSVTNKETDTRCPYRKISALENLVFRVLFPSETPVEDYSTGIIPLRVLQVLSHAKDLGMFRRFAIWHTPDHREKDPVLVAFTTDRAWDSGAATFLLARWGDALPSFDDLISKAKTAWVSVRRGKIVKARAQLDQALLAIETDAEAVFVHGDENNATYAPIT